ncbi:tetratricopeptide repeat protein [Sciscionella marina]|uniref:tetratricopeptide repeat protein n=1 Tax=Sciscionella marina TaxID=508770 RepID=UPI00039D9B9D|nr:tetratricopeptide repeat protein [Sciscionella marina]
MSEDNAGSRGKDRRGDGGDRPRRQGQGFKGARSGGPRGQGQGGQGPRSHGQRGQGSRDQGSRSQGNGGDRSRQQGGDRRGGYGNRRDDTRGGPRGGGERRFDDKRGRDGGSSGAKPFRSSGDKPYRSSGDKPFRDKPYRATGDKPSRDKPFRDKPNGGKPQRDRPFDDRGAAKREGTGNDRFAGKPHRDRAGGNKQHGGRPARDRAPQGRRFDKPHVANQKAEGERKQVPEPPLPEGIKAQSLDSAARKDLLGLPKDLADKIGKHLVAAGGLVDENPEQALAHARYARSRASRLAVVREAAGLAAYHAGEWAEAIAELRAYRRMTHGNMHLAVMADCERALGRPQRALDMAREARGSQLDKAEAVELRIVAAGARRDLGQLDAAVVDLQGHDLDPKRREPWSARLFYAYADNLLASGRQSEAVTWFLHAAEADTEDLTDAPERAFEVSEALRSPDRGQGS